ncbi:MAG: hypothetical protein P4L53_07185 [Candidatus Obscuribacterales bacterium]|nr:hypothetical protein [Candidatus Obscuribacterales bacterium]
MRKLCLAAASLFFVLNASLTLMPSVANPPVGTKKFAIHVRNNTGGRVDFEIRDSVDANWDSPGNSVLVKSFLPVSGACAVFPTSSSQSQWLVRYKKDNGTWSTAKTMQETDGWLVLR